MSVVLLYAGEVGPRVSLVECLRELHNEHRTGVLAEIMRRRSNNVPMDGLEDPGIWEGREALEGLAVQFRLLPERRRRFHLAAHAQALQGYKDGQSFPERIAVTDEVFAARRALIVEAVVEVAGFYTEHPPARPPIRFDDPATVERELEALEHAQLVTPLYEAAMHFQELPAGKALRFGLQAVSSSPTTIAASAQSIEDVHAVARVGASTSTAIPAFSPAPDGPPTRAPVATSSETQTSRKYSHSTEQRMGSLGWRDSTA